VEPPPLGRARLPREVQLAGKPLGTIGMGRMIDAAAFAATRPGVLVLNVTRGGCD